ncbi:MAG: hypothetical protein ACI9C4_000656 [Paraglaciecola sp.]|jgi:hypothetical protein
MRILTLLIGLTLLVSITHADQLQALHKSEYTFYQYYDGKLINGGNCVDTLIGDEVVVQLTDNNFKGRVGDCELLTTAQERYTHDADPFDSKAKAHTIIFESLAPQEQTYGLIIITSEILTKIKKDEPSELVKDMLAKTFAEQYPIVNQYSDSHSLVGKEFLRMGDSYGKYITYSIECWGDGDPGYGYYNVCEHSKNSGSYLLDIENFQSLKVNDGLPLSIDWIFQNKSDLIISGTASNGKSGGVSAAYILKNGSSREIYKKIFEGS